MINIQDKLERLLSKHIQSEPGKGYSVSVELDGKTLLKHYSGNIESKNTYYDVNANTAFDVGSLAKQFTACCIAILACEKRLSLDDSVRVYLPEMKEYAEKITIRHCIFMTSGVRQIYCLKHMQSLSPLSEMELFYRQEQPFNDVGNFSGYSNACYTLLGHIVEKVTGGINQFAKLRIFDPLGMTNTQGYGVMGDGGLYSTADDLALWHNCLMNRRLPGAPDGLFELLFSAFTLNDGEICPYGFGFFYDEKNRDIIWHHGDMGDWQCAMRVYLKKKLSIVVLTHYKKSKPVEIALDLENAVISELFDMPRQSNYKLDYYSRPKQISKIKRVGHPEFPNAEKQNPLRENNRYKYIGRYYSYEMDTYFDIIPEGDRFQMKYTYNNDNDHNNLIDFSDLNNLIARTRGDWGGDRLPMEFYGDEQKTNFFTLREGSGHFYFVKLRASQYDTFEFLNADNLGDTEIYLKLERQKPGDDKRGLVPSYVFGICEAQTGRKMGEICLRVGFNEKIYYGGNIGYTVDPEFRGRHYAARACLLLKDLAAKHGMEKLIITCNPDNIASGRTCELAGAELIGIVDLPEHNDMYKDGERQKCIYEIKL